MNITRGVHHFGITETFVIEVDDDITIHAAKMQANEVQLALHQELNGIHSGKVGYKHVENWAMAEASHMLTDRIQDAKRLTQQRIQLLAAGSLLSA
jgi:hypothetical protein